MINRKLSFQQKLMLSLLSFAIIPLIIVGSVFLYRDWRSGINETLTAFNSQLSLNGASINELFLSGNSKIDYAASNDYIREVLMKSKNYDLTEVYTSYEAIRSIFSALENDGKNNTFFIYSYDENIYNGNNILKLKHIPNEVLNQIETYKDYNYKWVTDKSAYEQRNEDYIGIYRTLYTSDAPYAVLEVRIGMSKLANTINQELPVGTFVSYWDRKGSTAVLKEGQETGRKAEELSREYIKLGSLSNYYVLSYNLKYNSHTLLMFIPKSHVKSKLIPTIYYSLTILVAIIAIIYMSVIQTSTRLMKTLKYTINKINKNIDSLITSEDTVTYIKGDEFGEINDKFTEMMATIKEYHTQCLQYAEEKKKLELKVLQERINPHFLYNTLSGIKWAYPDDELGKIIDSMVKYYRISLSHGNEIISIQEELDLIYQYLVLQRFAYDSDFVFTIECEEEAKIFGINKLLLQPILENAILHGINGLQDGGGHIDIKVHKEASNIIFTIKDNGVGMSEEKVAKILKPGNGERFMGYGMNNIQQRIKILYGEAYGISIESKQGKGTAVIMIIPVVMKAA
jgi:two-component system, sensor histidine kinase YesM